MNIFGEIWNWARYFIRNAKSIIDLTDSPLSVLVIILNMFCHLKRHNWAIPL